MKQQQTNQIEKIVSRRITSGRLRRVVALLSAFVLFTTMNTLKFNADTLERIPTCGIEQHIHSEDCYDIGGTLVCGLAEHVHTDACFQQRPSASTRIDEYVPLNAQVNLATPGVLYSAGDEVGTSPVDADVAEADGELGTAAVAEAAAAKEDDVFSTDEDSYVDVEDEAFVTELQVEDAAPVEEKTEPAAEKDAPADAEETPVVVEDEVKAEAPAADEEVVAEEPADEESASADGAEAVTVEYEYEIGDQAEVLLSAVLEALELEAGEISEVGIARNDEIRVTVIANEDGDYVIAPLASFLKTEIVVIAADGDYVIALTNAVVEEKTEETEQTEEAETEEAAAEAETAEETVEETIVEADAADDTIIKEETAQEETAEEAVEAETEAETTEEVTEAEEETTEETAETETEEETTEEENTEEEAEVKEEVTEEPAETEEATEETVTEEPTKDEEATEETVTEESAETEEVTEETVTEEPAKTDEATEETVTEEPAKTEEATEEPAEEGDAAEEITEEPAEEPAEETIEATEPEARAIALDFTDYIATDEHTTYLYEAAEVVVLVNTNEISATDGVAITGEVEPAEEGATLVISDNGEYILNGVTYTVTGLVLPEKSVTNADETVTIATANEEATLLNVEPIFEETAENYADIFSLFQAAESDPSLLASIANVVFGVAYAEEDARELQMKLFNIGLVDEQGEETEPGTAVHVQTSFDGIVGQDFALYHIVDGKPVLVEDAVLTDDEGRAVGFDFYIDSLSPFALVYYTVITETGETYTGYSLKTDERMLSAQAILETLGIQAVATGVTAEDESVEIDGLSIALPEDFAKATVVIEAGLDTYEVTLLATDELAAVAGDYAVVLDLSASGLDDSVNYKVTVEQKPATEEQVAAVEAALSDPEENKIAHVSNLEMVDISIVNIETGEAVEPDGPVSVSLTKAGEAVPTVVHFKDDHTTEVLEVAEDGSFTTESFSEFTGSYTVEYTTTDNVIEVKVDFTDIVKNGVDFDAQTVISALNDGVGIKIDELEKGYVGDDEGVVNGDLDIDYTTADNKESLVQKSWGSLDVVSEDPGLKVENGEIRVTADGTVVLSDGETTISIVISNYSRLLAEELSASGVDIEVLEGSVPAGSKVEYTDHTEEQTQALISEYNIEATENSGSFDVSIAMPEGGEYTEEGAFKVTVDAPAVEVPEGATAVYKVYHIHDGNVDKIEASVADGKLSFVTGSFSNFVYTVDFEFTTEDGSKIAWSWPGEGSYSIASIMAEIGVTGEIGQVALMCVKGEITEGGLFLEEKDGEQYLTSEAAFLETYELTVVVDGKTYILVVTDAIGESTNLQDFLQVEDEDPPAVSLKINGQEVSASSSNPTPVRTGDSFTLALHFREINGGIQFADGRPMSMTLPAALSGFGESYTQNIQVTLNDTDENGNNYSVNAIVTINPATNEMTLQWPEPAADADERTRTAYNLLKASGNAYVDITINGTIGEDRKPLVFKGGIERHIAENDEHSLTLSKNGTYKKDTGRVDYTIQVNSVGTNENVTVVDTIENAADSALVFDGSSNFRYTIYNKDGSVAKETTTFNVTGTSFEQNIGTLTNGQYAKIEYSAKVDTTKLTGTGTVEQTGNTVSIKDNNDVPPVTHNMQNQIDWTSVSKSSTGVAGGVETNNKVASWQIVANAEQRGSMTGKTITDSIGNNSRAIMTYADGITVEWYDGETRIGGETIHFDANDPRLTKTERTADKGESWTYTVPDEHAEHNYKYVITYNTNVDVTGQLQSFQVWNDVKTEGKEGHGQADVTPGIDKVTINKSVIPNGEVIQGHTIVTDKDYTSWKAEIEIPATGLSSAILEDYLPKTTIDGTVYVDEYVPNTLLLGGDWNSTIDDFDFEDFSEDENNPLIRLTFKHKADGTPGLAGTGSRRTIIVYYQTRNDPTWVETYLPGSYGAEYHTNTARFYVGDRNVQTQATIVPPYPAVKKAAQSWNSVNIDGKNYPLYRYTVTLYNVTKAQIQAGVTITDNHDSKLVYYAYRNQWDDELIVGETGQHDGNNDVYPTFSDDGSGHMTITAAPACFPLNGSGEPYNFYTLHYYMRGADVDELMAESMAGITEDGKPGKVEMSNEVNWDGHKDSVKVTYEYPGLDKALIGTNGRVAQFKITLNPEGAMIGTNPTVRLVDEYVNLSVDYSTIRWEPSTVNITYDFKGNKGTYIIPNGTAVTLYYNARILGDGNVNFSNKAEFGDWSDEVNEWRNLSVQGSGGAENYKIRLYKYASGHMEVPLGNTTFKLLDSNKQDMHPYARNVDGTVQTQTVDGKEAPVYTNDLITFTTASEGKNKGYVTVMLDSSQIGYALEKDKVYYLEEISAAPGFERDYIQYSFEISDSVEYDQKNGVYRYYNNDILKVSNKDEEGGLIIVKSLSGINWDNLTAEEEAIINNIDFTIHGKFKDRIVNAETGAVTYSETATEKDIVVHYSDFEDGRYRIEPGMLVVGEHYTVTEGSAAIEGYHLVTTYRADANNPTGTATDAYVEFSASDLAHETQSSHRLSVNNDYSTYSYNFKKAEMGSLDPDFEDGPIYLRGAQFSSYEVGGDGTAKKVYTTDSLGEFGIRWIDHCYEYNKLYYVVETKAPDGYEMLPESKTGEYASYNGPLREKYYFYFSNPEDDLAWTPSSVPDGKTAYDLTVASQDEDAIENGKLEEDDIHLEIRKEWKDLSRSGEPGNDITASTIAEKHPEWVENGITFRVYQVSRKTGAYTGTELKNLAVQYIDDPESVDATLFTTEENPSGEFKINYEPNGTYKWHAVIDEDMPLTRTLYGNTTYYGYFIIDEAEGFVPVYNYSGTIYSGSLDFLTLYNIPEQTELIVKKNWVAPVELSQYGAKFKIYRDPEEGETGDPEHNNWVYVPTSSDEFTLDSSNNWTQRVIGLAKGKTYHVVETDTTNGAVPFEQCIVAYSNGNIFYGGETAVITNTFDGRYLEVRKMWETDGEESKNYTVKVTVVRVEKDNSENVLEKEVELNASGKWAKYWKPGDDSSFLPTTTDTDYYYYLKNEKVYDSNNQLVDMSDYEVVYSADENNPLLNKGTMTVTNRKYDGEVTVDKSWLYVDGTTTAKEGNTAEFVLQRAEGVKSGVTVTITLKGTYIDWDNSERTINGPVRSFVVATGTSGISFSITGISNGSAVTQYTINGIDQTTPALSNISCTVPNVSGNTDIVVWVKGQYLSFNSASINVDEDAYPASYVNSGNYVDVPGTTIVLPRDANNGSWSYKWDDLPITTPNGGQYFYTVRETKVNGWAVENSGFDSTVTVGTAGVQNGTVSIKNTEKPGSLKLKKVVTVGGEATTGTLVDGTYTFTLKKQVSTTEAGVTTVTEEDAPSGKSPIVITISGGEMTSATIGGTAASIGTDGYVEVTGLEKGTYVLYEDATSNGTTLSALAQGYERDLANRKIVVKVEAGRSGDTVKVAGKATFTNDIDTGNLELNKQIAGSEADPDDEFTFEVSITVPEGVHDASYKSYINNATRADVTTVSRTVTVGVNLKGGQTYKIVGLPVGTTYTIVETEAQGYTSSLAADGVTGTIQNGGGAATFERVTNTKEGNGSLKLTKLVSVNGGTAYTSAQSTATPADGDYVFSIAGPSPATAVVKYVQIHVNNGVAESYKVSTENTDAAWGAALATTGSWATVSELIAGDYVITEIGKNGLTLTDVSGGKATSLANSTVTVTVVAGEDNPADASVGAATFTNNKDVVNLKLQKTVQNATGVDTSNQAFEFTVTLTAPTGVSFETSYPTVTTPNGGTATNGTANPGSAITVSLKNGDTWQINDLPKGTGYSITEGALPVGWTLITQTPQTSTIDTAGETAEVVFTNVYSQVEKAPQATKNLTGRDWGDAEAFEFTIESGDATTAAAITAGKVVMPGQTTANAAKTAQTATFGNITFKDAGTYYFIIKETAGSATGITYSQKEVKVKVEVTKTNGVLTATMTYADVKDDAGTQVEGELTYAETVKTFTNTYDTSTTAQIKGTKAVTHGSADLSGYSFTLAGSSGAPMPTTTTVTSAADGSFQFDTVTYTMAMIKADNTAVEGVYTKTYIYTVTEQLPAGAEPATAEELEAGVAIRNNVKYDIAPQTVTVTVTYNEHTGEIEATADPASLTVSFTNEQLGSLQVTKTVKLNGSADTTHGGVDLTFFVGMFETAESETAISGTVKPITVASGSATGTVTYDGLAIGSQYYVFETDASGNKLNINDKTQGYVVTSDGGQSTAITITPIVNIGVENEKRTGDLELTKQVTGDGADLTRQFAFTIALTAPQGESLAVSYPARHTGDNTVTTATITDGAVTGILLKDDEVYTITGLPEGTTYTITEADYSAEGYSASATSQTYGMNGTIPGGALAKAAVEVTNTYSAGELTVEKILKGNATDATRDFGFSVTFSKAGATGNNGTYKIGTAETIDSASETNIAFTEGVATVTFNLKGGEKAVFSTLPIGTTFTVTETSADADGYETTVSSTGGTVSGKNVTGEITASTSVTASYTNTRDTTTAEATKVWKDGETTIGWPADVSAVTFALKVKIGDGEAVLLSAASDSVKSLFTGIDETKNVLSTDDPKTASWIDLPTRVLIPAVEADVENGIEAQAAHWENVVYSVVETTVTYTDETTKAVNVAAENDTITNQADKTTISVVKSWKDVSTNAATVPDGASAILGLYTLSGTDTTAVTVTRHYDQNGQDETVPLTVTLDGTAVTEPESETEYGYAEEAWKATWKNLPKYNADGTLITYVVKEESTTPASITFTTVYDGDTAKKYATSTVENQYTSFRVQKRWMSNGTTWNPDYSVDTIYYKLAKIQGTDASTIVVLDTNVRTLTDSTTIEVATGNLGDDAALVGEKYPDSDENGYHIIPFADEIKPLPILETGWSYCAVECKSDGTHFEDGQFWTCNEFNGTVFAIKNDLVEVTAEKIWDDKGNSVDHPAITFSLYRTTETVSEWTNENGYTAPADWGTAIDTATIPVNATGEALTAKWSNLPKYDLATGLLYTYKVEETVPIGYTLKARGKVGGSNYAFSFENELTTTELTVEKKWKINGTDATDDDLKLVPEITYQVWREAYSDSEKTTKIDDSDENITDALKARTTGQIAGQLPIVTTTGEAPNVVESYAWTETVTNLPTTGQRETTTTDDNGTPEDDTDDTTTTTYSTVYYEYYIVETAGANGLYPSQTVTTLTDCKYVINNELTKISVTKKWKLNGIDVLNTELPQGSDGAPITSISFTLYQYDPTATEENSIKVYTGHNGTGNYTIIVKEEGEAPNTTYTWETLEIKWLPRYADATHKYEYYIVEDAISGHSSTVTKSDLTTAVNSGARVEDGEIVITNSKYSVSLPSTGGPGTTGFYVLGSILTLLALVLLVTKKRSDGAGIE